MKTSSKLTFIFGLSILFATSGCLRGETKSLSQIFEASRERFITASKDSLSPEAGKTLADLSTELDRLTKENTVSKEALTKIEESLSELLPLAGYPVRPSFTEIRNQFLEATGSENVSPSQAKMLATRAYNILSEELAQGRFQINK